MVERKSGQQDNEAVDAEMLDPNLYPGGLRHKEKPTTPTFPRVLKKKKHLGKKDEKLEGPELFLLILLLILLLIFVCAQCVCVWYSNVVYVPSTGIRDAEN